MNAFLNRVLAPGLRRVVQNKPPFKEIVEDAPAAPIASQSVPDDGDATEPSRGITSQTERPSASRIEKAEEPLSEVQAGIPDVLSKRPSLKRDPFLEEKKYSQPDEAARFSEKPNRRAETLSFETVTLDPAAPSPSMRRFQPSGEKAGTNREATRLKTDERSDRPSAREIVWEVLPVSSRTISLQKEKAGREESSPSEAPSQKGPVNPGVSDPMQHFLSGNLSPQRERKEEARPGPIPKRPAGSIPPRPDAAPEEEKGDLIIEQLEVRVVAEPARKPEPPKGGRTAPKRSGAWETAARYYLGKV